MADWVTVCTENLGNEGKSEQNSTEEHYVFSFVYQYRREGTFSLIMQ